MKAPAKPQSKKSNLANTAAKKTNQKSTELPKGVKTRLGAKLAPPNPLIKTFTIANLKKAKSKDELMFQIQECVALFGEQFEKMEMSMEHRARSVAFMLKEFQRLDIFASVDSLVYHRTGNTVMYLTQINSLIYITLLIYYLVDRRLHQNQGEQLKKSGSSKLGRT